MIGTQSLGRQVAFSMIVVAMTTQMITFFGFYITYWIVVRYLPHLIPREGEGIPAMDIIALVLFGLLGLSVAILSAVRLARRIVVPLQSVLGAAHEVAGGDLSARAAPADRSLGEIALLVDDFNVMAARLEKTAMDAISWNAQIAHELRTPLTILRGRIQGLSDGVFPADPRMFASLMTQVDGLARLVEDLRVVSLVDSGHIVLDTREVDVAFQVEELATLMRPALEAAGFTLTLTLARGLARVDDLRVRQALTALLENARQHADPGRVQVELTLTQTQVEIIVRDDGPGLRPEFQEHAFDLFARSDDGKRCHAMGSGLGLAVVRAIALAHGGTITYRGGEPGACFVLTLPRFGPRLT